MRLARAGEQLTTLDGQKRELAPDMFVITDSSGPIALAGVMGGEATEVHDGDRQHLARVRLLLALVDLAAPAVGWACSRRPHRASRRPSIAARAWRPLDRAAALMAEMAGGEVAPGSHRRLSAAARAASCTCATQRLWQVIGAEITQAEAAEILGRLGCEVVVDGDLSKCSVPTFRPDLEREIDLIEEVLRVWGMERVQSTLPAGRGRVGELTREQRWRERVGAALRASGLNETMTYSFADPADLERMRHELP